MCFKSTHIYKISCSFCVIVAYMPAHLIDLYPFHRPVQFVPFNICSEQRGFLIRFFFCCMLKNQVISFRLLWISACSFCVESECIFTILLCSTIFSTSASNTSGQRLLRKADFHLGQHINTFFRIRCKMTENSDRKHLQGAEKRHITMFGTYLSITYRAPPLSEPLISISPNI